MTTAMIVGMSQVLLALGSSANHGGSTTDDAVQLRIVPHVAVGSEDLTLARDTARALLAPAGIAIGWHECSAVGAPCEAPNGPNAITVRLLPTKVTGRHACGHLTRDLKLGTTALVHVLRHRELVRAVRSSSAGRSNPRLSSLKTGHVIGLTIAHEVGHALGLRHTTSGVMKAQIDIADLSELRGSRWRSCHSNRSKCSRPWPAMRIRWWTRTDENVEPTWY